MNHDAFSFSRIRTPKIHAMMMHEKVLVHILQRLRLQDNVRRENAMSILQSRNSVPEHFLNLTAVVHKIHGDSRMDVRDDPISRKDFSVSCFHA